MNVASTNKTLRSRILTPTIMLCVLTLGLAAAHQYIQPTNFEAFRSETLHDFTLSIYFDANDDGVTIETFLPQTDERQEIVRENVLSGHLRFDDNLDESGRTGLWTGQAADHVRYHALLSMRETNYTLDPRLRIDRQLPDWILPSTKAAPGIQVDHPEIQEIWSEIRPQGSGLLLPVLTSIYDFTYSGIKGAPFKGFTDALTALRLRQASCNGKGRLFVALARHNGIPARLVGGVILNPGSKKTSHQWVEVYIQDRWVPFDPTNGHFARLPESYLKLYIGDKSLFTHSRNINFDYLFQIETNHLSSALFRFDDADGSLSQINAAELLALTGLDEKTIGVFLLFPFGTLIIAFMRNIVGMKTFGTFMPMLIAAACVQTGLVTGLLMFFGVVIFAFAGHTWLDRHQLLKVPRLAAIITLCTGLFIVALWIFGDRSTTQFGILALFPVIIISFLAERIHQMASDQNWQDLFISAAGVLACTSLCYVAFTSVTLQSLFALMPELLLLVLAIQVSIGRWSGMRFSEYIRFRGIVNEGNVLGINSRNRDLIYQLNEARLLDLAADKLQSKAVLATRDIPISPTLATCSGFRHIDEFTACARELDTFVVKPNRGSQGNGILVIKGRDGEYFVTAGGRRLSLDDISQHTAEILSGSYAQDGQEDSAYLEPLLIQDDRLGEFASLGLSDIRVILHNQEPVAAMLRIPTRASGGKANLHQGAVGASIDLDTGMTTRASLGGNEISVHPDTQDPVIEFAIPDWEKILEISRQCSLAIPLGYIGVDICIDQERGPLVLEVNGRPGIEIQNVQGKGLLDDLDIVTKAL